MVADEAHALKNRSSIRTRKLRKVAAACESRILLTGASGAALTSGLCAATKAHAYACPHLPVAIWLERYIALSCMRVTV